MCTGYPILRTIHSLFGGFDGGQRARHNETTHSTQAMRCASLLLPLQQSTGSGNICLHANLRWFRLAVIFFLFFFVGAEWSWQRWWGGCVSVGMDEQIGCVWFGWVFCVAHVIWNTISDLKIARFDNEICFGYIFDIFWWNVKNINFRQLNFYFYLFLTKLCMTFLLRGKKATERSQLCNINKWPEQKARSCDTFEFFCPNSQLFFSYFNRYDGWLFSKGIISIWWLLR